MSLDMGALVLQDGCKPSRLFVNKRPDLQNDCVCGQVTKLLRSSPSLTHQRRYPNVNCYSKGFYVILPLLLKYIDIATQTTDTSKAIAQIGRPEQE